MRLDKFLKVSRIIKRRTVAAEAADKGHVSVNGRVAKPATDVKPGDVISIRFGENVSEFEVLAVAEFAGKAAAPSLYRVIKGAEID